MFPGVNPREMQKAMKRLGIRQEDIEAQEVIIKTPSKDLVIRSPQVSKINMMGQDTIQIVGEIEEVEKERKPQISEEDIETVIGQANCTREAALEALQESSGDLAKAILMLQKNSSE